MSERRRLTEEEKEEFRQIVRQELMMLIGRANNAPGVPQTDIDTAVKTVFTLLTGAITSENNYALEREEKRKEGGK
jgi:hypothetical protein